LLNTVFVPFSELDADVKQFKANVALVNNISCLYRSIYKGDKTAAPNGNIKLVVDAIINLYNSTLDVLPKLPARFRPNVSITSLDDIPNFFTKRRSVFNNYLKIDPATSDPSVQVVQIPNGDGSTSLKFINTSGVDKDVTYNVKYVNPDYGQPIEKAMIARVIALVDSIPIYRESAVGNYVINNWVGNGPNSVLKLKLSLNGEAEYTVFNDPSWPSGTSWPANWDIIKLNGKYYYWESGYWHFAYPNIEVLHPLKYPVTSFKYHEDTEYVKQ